jgi:2Fe-2S ferredoxin
VPAVRITFIQAGGESHTIEAETGQSLMEAATAALIPGIVAECSGELTCATCHVYVEPGFAERFDPPAGDEVEMLECALDPGPTSRLSCQLPLSDAVDGLVVRLPEAQQ